MSTPLQEIDQIVACFDPNNSGFITFDKFEHGIEQLFQNNKRTTSKCAPIV